MLDTCAHREATVDCGALYERTRAELIDLVRSLDTTALDTIVPATPAWRVRDVLAHVVGITHDLNGQRFDVVDPDAWTRRQVDERRDDDVETMVAEWDREAPTFEEGLRVFGYEVGSHYVADLHAHLSDVRGALGDPTRSDDLTVLVSLDFFLGSLDDDLRAAGIGAVELVAGGERHVAGSDAGADGVHATVRGDAYALLRVLSARRSRGQIRGLDWSGDVELVLEQLARYPLPERDLDG